MKHLFILLSILGIHQLHSQQIKNNVKIQVKNPVKTVQIDNIEEWLCPSKLLRGDREFDGNGPVIKSEVKLRISPNKKELWADISINAKETKHDWSETEGKWSKKVYDAPYGLTINAILSDKASRTKFVSPRAGFQLLVPGADVANVIHAFFDNEPVGISVFKAHGIHHNDPGTLARLITGKVLQGNTVVTVPPTEGALVKFFHIVGDTGGDDISNDTNCNDDLRIHKIEFFPVKLEMTKE